MGFVPGWKPVAPAGAVELTFAVLEQRLNDVAAEQGELFLTIPAAFLRARKPLAER